MRDDAMDDKENYNRKIVRIHLNGHTLLQNAGIFRLLRGWVQEDKLDAEGVTFMNGPRLAENRKYTICRTVRCAFV